MQKIPVLYLHNQKNYQMKNKITLFIIMLFAGIVSAQAQGFQKRTVEERVKQSIARISDSLSLTQAQKDDINPVMTEYFKGQDKLREALAPGARPERSEIEKLVGLRDAKLKVILTEAQFNKYKEMDAAMRNRRPQKVPGQ
mgnify:CR=1 FL=1